MLIQVLDPGEVSLKWTDDVDFEDLETAKSEKVYLSPNFKKDYYKKFMEHIFAIREICKDTGVDFFSVSTEKPLFDAFVGILEGQMNRGGFEWEKQVQEEQESLG